MTEKTITKEQLDAIQKDMEAKQAEAIDKARQEAEAKVKAEYEAKAKAAETKSKEERLEAELKALKESQENIKREMEEKIVAERKSYEEKLAGMNTASNRVASNNNPFDDSNNNEGKPSVESVDLKEVEKLSAKKLAEAWGVPPDHPILDKAR